MAAIDTAAFPPPRLTRTGGVPIARNVAASLSPPNTRAINFFVNVTPNVRSTRFAGPFRGPALIRHVQTVSSPVAANNNFFFFPSYHSSPIDEQLVPITNPYTWTTYFERMPVQGADYNAATRGIVNAAGLTQKVNWDMPVDIIVPLSSWYLLMTVGQVGGAGAAEWHGYVTIVEGVNPDALANFL